MLLRSYPAWMVEEHTNIAHLAWEQRDGGAHWREMYEDFDHVWAISGFAAESLEKHLHRPVHVVNCVVRNNRLVEQTDLSVRVRRE